MANLTLVIDDDVLRRARIRALEQGTSVNAVVRDYIENFAGEGEVARRGRALREFLQWAQQTNVSSGPGGREWTRDDIYEERLARYGG